MSFKTILSGNREEKLSMLYGALWYAVILSFVGWYLYRVAHKIFYTFGEQTPMFIAVMAVYFILDHFRKKTAVFCRNFFIRRQEPLFIAVMAVFLYWGCVDYSHTLSAQSTSTEKVERKG
jgi:branched-subunit amino acid ABC-type transport system permease component